MIRANELRIGNSILLGGNTIETYQTYKPYKVDADAIQAIAEENKERGDDYILSVFQPIPLTPKILEKCGLQNGVFPDLEYFSIDNDLSVCFEGAYTACDIKFLHQLQNLYFALTGEELPTQNIDIQ